MIRVEKHHIKPDSPFFAEADDLCFRSKNLSNLALYEQRQRFFEMGTVFSYEQLDVRLKTSDAYRGLPAKVSQQVLKQVCQDWTSYFAATAEYAREYLWKAVHTFLPEGSEAATAWVKAQESRFLLGQVGLVIDELRHRLSIGLIVGKSKTETVHKVIAYFDTNRSRMRYDQYLRAGFPIGSGAVESACNQLIVTRMEGAGMHWTVTGAQAMARSFSRCLID